LARWHNPVVLPLQSFITFMPQVRYDQRSISQLPSLDFMATTLLERYRQSYRDLELFPLTEADKIEAFRIEYGGETLARLEQAVEDAPRNGKVIFAGHRGCGKSTLLWKFGTKMQRQNYFVVFFSVSDVIEMSDVNHVTILYAVALKLLSEATKLKLEVSEEMKRMVLDWRSTTRSETTTEDQKAEIGIGGDALQVATFKLKNESSYRQELKRTYEKRISELVRQADLLTAAIQGKTKKEVLVIIDDLDKIDLALVRDVYRDNVNALMLPQFRIVFTIPVSVIRDIELRTILQNATGTSIQQMEICRFYKQGGSRDPQSVPKSDSMKLFLEVLDRRIPESLIEPDVAQQMVLKSGGVVRELVRIARGCCSQCLLQIRSQPELTEIKIDQEIFNAAIRDLRNEFAASLGEDRYSILIDTYQNGEPKDITNAEFLLLLHGLYVLEYQNDDLWYEVHPIVVDLLKRKQRV
jgi:energy-coupling factor transporter ATP-binding protein EcfA2